MGSNDMFEYQTNDRTNDVSEHLEPSREAGALSGFKADFGPLLGTSNSSARDAYSAKNTKFFRFQYVKTLPHNI